MISLHNPLVRVFHFPWDYHFNSSFAMLLHPQPSTQSRGHQEARNHRQVVTISAVWLGRHCA